MIILKDTSIFRWLKEYSPPYSITHKNQDKRSIINKVTGFVKLKTIAQQDLEQKNLSIRIVILSNNTWS